MKMTASWVGILSIAALIAIAISHRHAHSFGETPTKGAFGETPTKGESLTETEGQTSGSQKAADESSSEPIPKDLNKPNYDSLEKEREKIWNSTEMLRARVWLETYFKRSAKISDKQAKKYMDELRTMYPDQMKLWLMKFQTDRQDRKQQYDSQRQARHEALSARQASPQVGGFQNPYAGRRAVSSGQPIGNVRQSYGGGAFPVTQHQPIQKPFSSPAYRNIRRPLVTSEEVARWEILRGLGWAPY